jgi:hypothetical protein
LSGEEAGIAIDHGLAQGMRDRCYQLGGFVGRADDPLQLHAKVVNLHLDTGESAAGEPMLEQAAQRG